VGPPFSCCNPVVPLLANSGRGCLLVLRGNIVMNQALTLSLVVVIHQLSTLNQGDTSGLPYELANDASARGSATYWMLIGVLTWMMLVAASRLVSAVSIGRSVPWSGFYYCCATYVYQGFLYLCATCISTVSVQLVY
jgi:hypothetical protein